MQHEFTGTVVQFYSGRQKIVGDLFMPVGTPPKGGFPAIICAHGYGGIRTTSNPPTARAYAQAGFASLIFDYRGFGDSEGDRWRLVPRFEVDDVRNAVTFLSADSRINAEKIAVHGASFGGAVVVAATAADTRIKAMICNVGIGNGRRWLQSLRRNWEWIEFEQEVAADRRERVLTGKSRPVDPYYIMMSDKYSEKRHDMLNEQFPERKFELPLESAELIMEFVPEDEAAIAPPRPGLIIGVANDFLVAETESRQIFEKWPGPKRLVWLQGFQHHDVYSTAMSQVLEASLPFLREHLDLSD